MTYSGKIEKVAEVNNLFVCSFKISKINTKDIVQVYSLN